MTKHELATEIEDIIFNELVNTAPGFSTDTWKIATEIVDTFGTVLGAEKEDSNDKE